MILLDASVIFEFFTGKGSADRTALILKQGKGALSVITVYELFAGVVTERHIREREDLMGICQILPLTPKIARIAAGLYTDLKHQGRLLPNEDLLIAATALGTGCRLHTLNAEHFNRVPGLMLDQPDSAPV
jgi:tRNA(fMet)-specific endonuclease VapC